ncbi:MAG: CCA tRNA nucleotidyltransferase [Bosea sp. (in: a-proteobacteria)]
MAGRFATLLARPPVHALLQLLNTDGAETRIVGGAIRNTLLGLPTTDIDLATTLKPDETMARAAKAGLKVVPTGLSHGTVTIIIGKTPFEVTTLRRDVETDGRHAVVAFSDSFKEDALRRDFTINQLSLSADGTVNDYAGGLADLAVRKVRFIGDPSRRITEDYLRIMRFFRFHAEYGKGALDTDGLAACKALKDGMVKLSAERIRTELMKLLVAKGAAEVLPVFAASGIWHEAAGNLPAHLEAFHAAVELFPTSDAPARLAALSVRTRANAAALDLKLKLSSAERTRLDDAAKALAELGATTALTDRNYQLTGLHLGASAVHDALGILAQELGESRAHTLRALLIPVSPFKGADVLALGIPAGPTVGAVIARANQLWADLGFPDDAPAQQQCLRNALA